MIADIDDIAERSSVKFKLEDLPRRDIFNGFYTLEFSCGSHRTFRLFTQQKGKLAGKRILGMLIGPDNTSDYEDFAFLIEEGIRVWGRFANQKQAGYANILWKIMNGEVIEGHELTESRRCLRCNRNLTDPLSNSLGIGPTCRGA